MYIKKYPKILIYLFAFLLFGFTSTNTSYASGKARDYGTSDVNKVKISITNNQTGETKVLDPTTANHDAKINSIQSKDKSKVVGYEVFVPIENSNSSDSENKGDSNPSDVSLLDVTGGSKTAGGVTAKLNVDYDISSNGEKIRLNKVYGSWTPSDSMYYLTDRKVEAHSGAVWGNNLSKTPTSNTFSYTTGWGYNYFAGGQGSPRAWSSAIIHITGMSATYTITLEITYP
ncbi:hypothetical protein KFV09_06175 [Anoxybacillus rupiensis]|uniref:hypothetical protein n=1 Tax=Anoxybacteroides rupiense TaxID=311460 RepID=UPI001BA86AE5|nr:hypothetical protein [Anoxybacillus rupiensis]MBS2771132.1 hypothetical protein [Anoxybacillus rupiensis]